MALFSLIVRRHTGQFNSTEFDLLPAPDYAETSTRQSSLKSRYLSVTHLFQRKVLARRKQFQAQPGRLHAFLSNWLLSFKSVTKISLFFGFHRQRQCLVTMDNADLDHLQQAYRQAVDQWVANIREEEALAANAEHSLISLDDWKQASIKEEEMRNKVQTAKKHYQDALRKVYYGF